MIDKQKVIRYIGAINDQYTDRTTRLAAPTMKYLKGSLDQVLSGRPLDPANTRAIGCPIARASKPVLNTGVVTFHKHVEPLRMLPNHSPSGLGRNGMTPTRPTWF